MNDNSQNINDILKELAFTWKQYPETTFGELMISVLRTGHRADLICTSLEYMSDEEFLEGMARLVAKKELYPRNQKSYPGHLAHLFTISAKMPEATK